MKDGPHRSELGRDSCLALMLLAVILAVFVPVAVRAFRFLQTRYNETGGDLTSSDMARALGIAFGTVFAGVVKVVAVLILLSLAVHAVMWLGERLRKALADLQLQWQDRPD